ncbi:C-type lectin domain family 2 member D11-like isoform X2 [Lagopus muta]|uniref:C-type lectin domain family 2 member D11-like isoform X2 n=1 Tax=Lagopus muta TaxID=64668 RepID=UPI00209D95D3|nr:C-type lectin domain family 2 member D11-like isoform X2 [Lagopus muta]
MAGRGSRDCAAATNRRPAFSQSRAGLKEVVALLGNVTQRSAAVGMEIAPPESNLPFFSPASRRGDDSAAETDGQTTRGSADRDLEPGGTETMNRERWRSAGSARRRSGSKKRRRMLCMAVCAVPWILVLVLLAVIVLQHSVSCSPRPPFSHVCPDAWLGLQGKCFYFSANESDWDSSREHCQRLGASLATVDTEEQMEFMLRYLGPANCWIGLHRAEGDERWTWADGSAFSNWFQLQGGGRCAYLNGDRISSALCHTKKLWVCSRADSFVLWRNGTNPQ